VHDRVVEIAERADERARQNPGQNRAPCHRWGPLFKRLLIAIRCINTNEYREAGRAPTERRERGFAHHAVERGPSSEERYERKQDNGHVTTRCVNMRLFYIPLDECQAEFL
jgi:hypothetical protein